MAAILTLSDQQIEKAQTVVNNYIMDKNETKRNWLSKDRIYQPIEKGGLNCIEINDFLHAIRINWMYRYTALN